MMPCGCLLAGPHSFIALCLNEDCGFAKKMWGEHEAKMKAKREINNRNKARGRHSDKAAKQGQTKPDELIVPIELIEAEPQLLLACS